MIPRTREEYTAKQHRRLAARKPKRPPAIGHGRDLLVIPAGPRVKAGPIDPYLGRRVSVSGIAAVGLEGLPADMDVFAALGAMAGRRRRKRKKRY